MSKKKAKIGTHGRVRVIWKTNPYDYSLDKEKDIRVAFAKKYGISRDHVRIEPKFYTVVDDGSEVEYTNENARKIHDKDYQRKLFKRYLDIKGVEDYDFDAITRIDDIVNGKIDYEVFDQNHKYDFKWIRWSNFMSYGKDNFFDFTSLKGLILLTSTPANQGGKTTFCIDLFRFLLFGKITTREDDWKLERVFNRFLPEETEVSVEGCINIEGQDYVIKRTLTRPALSKRTNKSKITNKVKYFRLIGNEYEELVDEESNEGVSNTDTNRIIKEAIGNDEDFDMMISVNSDNLKKLISLKDTERGLFISRWLGLYILEKKCEIAKAEYSTFKANSLKVRYDRHELQLENDVKESINQNLLIEKKKEEEDLKSTGEKIKKYRKQKEDLISSKIKVDDSYLIDVHTVERKIEELVEKGKVEGTRKDELERELKAIQVPAFDKNELNALEEKHKKVQLSLGSMRGEYQTLTKNKENLVNGQYCPTCHQRLADVDNSKAINEIETRLEELRKEGISLAEQSKTLDDTIKTLKEAEAMVLHKMQIETRISSINVNLSAMRQEYKTNKDLLKSVKDNEAAIRTNNDIDAQIRTVEGSITEFERQEREHINKIASADADIKQNTEEIKKNKKLIEQLLKEEKEFNSWDLYLEIIGKHGISKMIVREMLPIINSEMSQLLNDVCDFTVEITMNEKNDVAFYLIHDGERGKLGSGSGFEQTVASLALRTVLSKYSSFSKPSFVIFDEILGGVADENYEQTKLLYDKIIKDYKQVFQITHIKALADWHDHKIVISKINNISKIALN